MRLGQGAAPTKRRAGDTRLFDAGGELLLIDPSALARPWPPFVAEPEPGDRPLYQRDGALAVVQIDGPLDQRGSRWGWWDGYDRIAARVCAALLDQQVGVVVLRINSPGGVVAGCFEAVATILRAKKASGKQIHVIVDEQACSAAYALATVGNVISVPQTGEVGSVGVIATYFNYSESLKKEGVRVAVITSGKFKADGSPIVPWDDAMIERMRAEVLYTAGLFFDLVAANRKLKVDTLQGFNAGTYYGAAAVEVGLADRVCSPAEALETAREAANTRRLVMITAARAEKDKETMKLIAKKLGLAEDASEDAILAALAPLLAGKISLEELCAVTGKPSSAEAVGVVKGWSATAEQYASLIKERATEQKAALDASIESVFTWAIENGRRTPAQVDAARKSMAAGVLQLDSSEAVAAYRAEIEAGPVVVPGKETPLANGEGSVVGKRWEDMSTVEKHRLYNDPNGGRALYEEALADYKQRQRASGARVSNITVEKVAAPTSTTMTVKPAIPAAKAAKPATTAAPESKASKSTKKR